MPDTFPQPEPEPEPETPESGTGARTRGVPLTILLVVLTLTQAIGTVLLVALLLDAASRGQDTLPVAGSVLLGLLALVGLCGTWAWWRWGVYLFALVALIGSVTDAAGGLSPTLLAVRLVLVAATLVLIRQRWTSFT